VAHVVGAEPDMHEPGHPAAFVGVLVVLQPLDERTRAVTHAHDGHTYRTHQDDSFLSLLMRCRYPGDPDRFRPAPAGSWRLRLAAVPRRSARLASGLPARPTRGHAS